MQSASPRSADRLSRLHCLQPKLSADQLRCVFVTMLKRQSTVKCSRGERPNRGVDPIHFARGGSQDQWSTPLFGICALVFIFLKIFTPQFVFCGIKFFSSNYSFLWSWVDKAPRPRRVLLILASQPNQYSQIPGRCYPGMGKCLNLSSVLFTLLSPKPRVFYD